LEVSLSLGDSSKYSVTLPDANYYEDEVECRTGCPVKTDCRGYLLAAAKGDFREGYAISRATNPFASICGKVCGAPCEATCRRKDVDETLSIRNMKGFLTQKHGPETGDLKTPLTYSTVRGSLTPKLTGKKVAIIGGGCAGYTCAHDLARLGHASTIFERHPKSGGMLIQGVPKNRLSRPVVQAEIDSILQFPHIEVRHNQDVGVNISFQELVAQYDAVLIAVGLAVGKILPMPNSDNPNIHSGLKFLLDFNIGTPWNLTGRRSIVIGGGDVAFDVARSALRSNAPHVELCCLEREALGEMRGSADEREGGRREGVIINDGWGPAEIVIENGKLKGLMVQKVKRVLDANGRFAPEYFEEKRLVEGDDIFMAVGQGSDLKFLENSGVKITRMGTIEHDPVTLQTSVPGVFTSGDVAYGPKLFINAVASGSFAALSIDSFLTKTARQEKKRLLSFTEIEDYERSADYLNIKRKNRDELPVNPAKEPEKNTTVEYTNHEACGQSERCLACHIHPTFEGNICILCGGCVDVCPSYCLSMKTLDQLEYGEDVKKLAVMEFGDKEEDIQSASAMLFDPLKCIRCGMCAIKCPTGACKMSANSFVDTYVEARL